MKSKSIIERIAAAFDRAAAEATPRAQATGLSAVESERVFRQSKSGTVTINLPSVATAIPATSKATPPLPRISSERMWQAAAEGLPRPSKSEMSALTALQTKWDAASLAVNEQFTPDAAQKQFRQISKEEWRKAYETNTPPENLTLTSEADVTNAFETKRRFAEMSLAALGVEAEELCAPIRRSFLAAATRHLELLEREEKAEFEKFGHAWNPKAPGPRIVGLRSLIARLRSSETNSGQSSPKHTLVYLQFD